MNKDTLLNSIFGILDECGGYFVVPDEKGNDYMILAKKNYEVLQNKVREVQLTLPVSTKSEKSTSSADEILEKINRDIALFHLQQEDQTEIDLAEEIEEPEQTVPVVVEPEVAYTEVVSEENEELPPPRRVRFEPLRGDLPPELQE